MIPRSQYVTQKQSVIKTNPSTNIRNAVPRINIQIKVKIYALIALYLYAIKDNVVVRIKLVVTKTAAKKEKNVRTVSVVKKVKLIAMVNVVMVPVVMVPVVNQKMV
jgi:hypothetical protein